MEIYSHNTSTKRGLNIAHFSKIGKSGDVGHSGDILGTVAIYTEKPRRKIMMLMISNHLMTEVKEILKLKLGVSIVYYILIFGYIRSVARKGIDVHATKYLQISKVINP